LTREKSLTKKKKNYWQFNKQLETLTEQLHICISLMQIETYPPGTLFFARPLPGRRCVGFVEPFDVNNPQIPKKSGIIYIPSGTLLIALKAGMILLGKSTTQYEVIAPNAEIVWIWSSSLELVWTTE